MNLSSATASPGLNITVKVVRWSELQTASNFPVLASRMDGKFGNLVVVFRVVRVFRVFFKFLSVLAFSRSSTHFAPNFL